MLLVSQQHQQRIPTLEQRVRDLEEQLHQNSSNSSRPPSTDPPAVKRAPPRTPSGRRRGGQPGHSLQQRPLLPQDHTLVLSPANCRGCATTEAVCRELLEVEPALGTFVRVEGIEPTNNAAERALRHTVMWRRTSYGTDSVAGSHFVANILSIVATCQQQERNVLEFLSRCCQGYIPGTKPPSLLLQGSG